MKPVTYIILCAVILICLGNTGYAQDKDQDLPDVNRSIVTFKLQSAVELSGEDQLQVPSKITAYLDKQKPLASLNIDVDGKQNTAWLQASYVFPSMQAYLQWRNSDETKQFIQSLREKNHDEIHMKIALRRRPIDEYVKYTNQDQ